jgi:hypothetical protein
MDEDGHPRALKPKRRSHENDCNTGLARKAHRFLSLLFARAAHPFFSEASDVPVFDFYSARVSI